MRKKDLDIATILVVLLLIVILLVFVISLGSVNTGLIGRMPEAFKDNKEEAKRRHKKLLELIQKQEALKVKLAKKFKRIYFLVRIGLFLIWFAVLSVCYFNGLIGSLGDVLDYSEASILLLVVLNFLTFGTLTNLESYLTLIKTKTENWIYGKYLGIDDRIELNKAEVTLLSKEIGDQLE